MGRVRLHPTSSSTARRDLLWALGLGVGALPASLIPPPLARALVKVALDLFYRIQPETPAWMAERIRETLGSLADGVDLPREVRHFYGHDLEGALGRMQNLLWNGWHPRIEVEGLERLKEAQRRGGGTVLWRMSFGDTMIVKAGLFRAGIDLVHLSRASHGSRSESWVSSHVLAPFYRRTEGWYLKERVIIPADGGTNRVMKLLLARLTEENAVVSIVGDLAGTQNVTTPFFDGQAHFAIGAPALAWKAGSTLIPVLAVRSGALHYRVILQDPIPVDRSLDRKAFVESAVEEFSGRLQRAVARHPGSWGNWNRFWGRTGAFQESAKAPPP